MIGLGKSGTKTVNSWGDNDYRKLTFLGRLPATLLDWLKSNAVRDGALNPVYLWKGYDVKLSLSVGSAIDWDNSVEEPEGANSEIITMYSALTIDDGGRLTGSGNTVRDYTYSFLAKASQYASYFWHPYNGWVQGIKSDWDESGNCDLYSGYPVSATYSKGSTEKRWIASENRSAYPANGRSGNTWYVRQ